MEVLRFSSKNVQTKKVFHYANLLSGERCSVGHPEGGAEDGVELLRLEGGLESEGVALLELVLAGRMPGHEAEQAAGRVAGGVGDPLEGVAHQHLGAAPHCGDGDSLQGYRHQDLLSVVVASLAWWSHEISLSLRFNFHRVYPQYTEIVLY